jgi:type I restriction enzyme S subunit
MKDWHRKTIGDICRFSNGYGFTPRDWAKKGWPIIRIQNLNGSGNFNYYDGEPDPSWIVEPGELLFAWAGVPGVSFGPTIWQGPRGVLNQHIYRITPHDGIDRDWLYAALKVVTSRIERKAHGFKSSLLHVKKSDITDQQVHQPKLEEQVEIARIISVGDRSIDLTELLLAAKQERRTWLMQQLLTGKRRLPGFGKPWQTVHLGEVFTNRIEINYPDLPLVAITGTGGVISREDLVRRDNSSEDKGKYLRICPGDIGYNTMRMWQGVCGLSSLEGIVSPAYTIATPNDEVDGEYMALLFKSRHVVHFFHRHSQGLVDDTLNLKWRHFAEIKVNIPERSEQQAIAAVFKTADRELDLLRVQLNALREQKKGLMQQLLTGKMRVRLDA